MRRQEVQIERARQRELERTNFATLYGGSKRSGPKRALVALLEQRMHALAELGQLSLRTLAPKQIATELVLELLDGTGERRLCHIALLRSLGEIQLTDRRQEISDLMHFHGSNLPPYERKRPQSQRRRLSIAGVYRPVSQSVLASHYPNRAN